MKSVIICGEEGCGKTTNAEKIARHFKLAITIPELVDNAPVPQYDCLIFTSEPIEEVLKRVRNMDVGVCLFEDALQASEAV
jgi:broad-specificity NMP kinase